MAFSNKCTAHILGRLDASKFLAMYPHSCVPCHNLQSDVVNDEIRSTDFFSGFFKKLPYHVSCPIPASFPVAIERQVVNGMDPAFNLVRSKKHWEDYKLQILKFCDNKVAGKVTGISAGTKKIQIPLNVLQLANHIKNDPDAHFDANYNSYFTGSNATCLDLGSDKYLVSPRSYGGGELGLSRLYLNGDQWDVEYQSSTSSSTEIPECIYEVKAANNIILTRQRNAVSLFSIENGGNGFTLQKGATLEKDCPFVSVSINGSNFCTLSAERQLDVFDGSVGRTYLLQGTTQAVVMNLLVNPAQRSQVDNRDPFLVLGLVMGSSHSSMSPILQSDLQSEEELLSDRWGSVYYVNDNTLSFLDRFSYNLIDLRVKADIVRKWPINSIAEQCEEVYSGATGFNEMQYVVTSHQMLSLDFRQGFSQRWTHNIDHSPALISVLTQSSTHDTLFIGSQTSDTVILVENDRTENNICSKVHPYALPSLRETFHLSRFNGYCLTNTASSRFEMSLTGLCCLENAGTITLFRTTSIGDVFKQVLTLNCSNDSEIQLSESELNKIEEWEEQCEDLLLEQNNPCFVTDLLDTSHLLHCIQNKGKQYEETFDKIGPETKVAWKVSKKDLLSYCDYLAPRILEEWGIEDEEEWCLSVENDSDELSSDDEEDVTTRVEEWIKKYAGDMGENLEQDSHTFDKDENPELQDSQTRDRDENPEQPMTCSNETEDITKAKENDNSDNPKFDTFEESEIDFKSHFSNSKTTSSTPRIKFISGF